MRLAEKTGGFAGTGTSEQKPVVEGDDHKTPPAASLTAAIIRRQEKGDDAPDTVETHPAVPPDQAPDFTEPQPADEPIGARAQQAKLEQAFADAPPEYDIEVVAAEEPASGGASHADSNHADDADLEPVEFIEIEDEPIRVQHIERSELENARQSAANWSFASAPSASFWEGVAKDVSIFVIVFAALVFLILQAVNGLG